MMRKIIIAFVLLSIISCQKNDKEYIALNTNLIHFDAEGGDERIDVNSNFEWCFLNSIPDWCRIERIGETEIRVTVSPNINSDSRTCSVFVGKEVFYSLFTIEQDAKEDNAFRIPVLPFNSVKNVEYREDDCEVTAEKLFAPASMLGNLRIGGAIEDTADDVGGFKYHKEYNINPVTVSAGYLGEYYDEIWTDSSYETLERFASRIIESSGQQNAQFYYSSPIAFNTYRQLDLIGRLNMSGSLSEIMGLSDTSYSTAFKTGLIYSFSQELFKISMDYPERLIDIPIDPEIANKLLYINSVVYGRTSLMIVLSELEREELAEEINNVLEGKTLLTIHNQKFDNTLFYLIRFDEKKNPLTVSGGQGIIGDFINASDNQIIPLSFTVNDYKDNSVGLIHFNIKY